MMKSLSEYMDPEFLVSDSTYTAQQLQQKKIAMAHLWASRAHAMDDPNRIPSCRTRADGVRNGSRSRNDPCCVAWWDGIVLPSGISDEEADAAFRAAMEGIDTEMAVENSGAAIWLIKGYEPGRYAEGAVATAQTAEFRIRQALKWV